MPRSKSVSLCSSTASPAESPSSACRRTTYSAPTNSAVSVWDWIVKAGSVMLIVPGRIVWDNAEMFFLLIVILTTIITLRL